MTTTAPPATHPAGYRPFGADTWRDPFDLYRWLRDDDPVHHAPGGFWVLSRFADVFEAARDTATFSSAHGLSFRDETELLELAPTIVMMDPPDHTRYRRLVNRGFTPRHVTELEPDLRRTVRARLDALADAGDGADLVAHLARPIPSWVVAHYLGVPEEDRGRFERWTVDIVGATAAGDPFAAGDALGELYGYFRTLVDRRRAEGAEGDDLVSILLRADDDGTGIGLDGILGYAFVMIAGGNDTATGLIGCGAELLAAHPDQRRRLAEQPERIGDAVEELLRLTSPVQGLCRATTRDVDVAGTTIPAGDRVLLCYAAANRDDREFGADAERLDVDRDIKRQLSFSSGSHYCLGSSAARLQARVVFEELLARFPDFEVDTDAGRFADGAFTRRYASLPFSPSSAR